MLEGAVSLDDAGATPTGGARSRGTESADPPLQSPKSKRFPRKHKRADKAERAAAEEAAVERAAAAAESEEAALPAMPNWWSGPVVEAEAAEESKGHGDT